MPMLLALFVSGPHGVPIEVRVADRLYTIHDAVPVYVEKEDVTNVTNGIVAQVPAAVISTPPAAQ